MNVAAATLVFLVNMCLDFWFTYICVCGFLFHRYVCVEGLDIVMRSASPHCVPAVPTIFPFLYLQNYILFSAFILHICLTPKTIQSCVLFSALYSSEGNSYFTSKLVNSLMSTDAKLIHYFC